MAESIATTPEIVSLFERYITKGVHPEYQAYVSRVASVSSGYRRASNPWDLIRDAVSGSGGFSNGEYLFPFKAEVENNALSEKFQRRKAEADYDRFAEHVCNAPWDLIVSGSDMIARQATSEAETLLGEFWANVDNRGTSMLDFLEFPFGQGRRYGTGWIVMDRPDVSLVDQRDNLRAARNRPYAYAVPTQNVVDWSFDDDGNLTSITILEPEPYAGGAACPVRIWTLDSWALFKPSNGNAKKSAEYVLAATGPNNLGVIPAVPCWNDQPSPGMALGDSEMLEVARLAQTVYNIDSEAREIERKCALFLAVPVKRTADYEQGRFIVGTDSALLYDGEAGRPEWVSPDLTILQRLDERRKQKKDSAYEMAHLRALNSSSATVQTSSGFHAEVEFQKTERRVARHAATLEAVEKKLASLYLRFYGIDDNDSFSITYPRDFGVRDMQKLIDEVSGLLDMNLGEESDRAELSRLFQARHPRKADGEIAAMVDAAIGSRSNAAKQKSAVERIKLMAAASQPPAPPLPAKREVVQ